MGKSLIITKTAKRNAISKKIVSGADFFWLVIQRVLPKGFRRARNFGFLHPNSKKAIQFATIAKPRP